MLKNQSLEDSLAIVQPQLLAWTETWAHINSYSYNIPGLKEQAEAFKQAFDGVADHHETHALPHHTEVNLEGKVVDHELGELLIFNKRPEAKRQILFMGHYDTVYAPKLEFDKAHSEGNILYGPGVADMKGGLAIMIGSLTALERANLLTDIGWQVVLNPDEEIGSPGSSHLFNRYVKHKECGFIFEPSVDQQGTLAYRRKGSGNFSLKITGKAAHAGRAFTEGRSAIIAAATAIQQIHALNDKFPQATFNVGLIKGGSALNAVADTAVIKINSRVPDADTMHQAEEALENITEAIAEFDGIETVLVGSFQRPPKNILDKTAALFERVLATSEALGDPIKYQDTGGVCDGNNLEALGLPVIDTLGAYGGKLHSPAEFMNIDSLAKRTRLLCYSLLALQEQPL